MHEDSFAKTMSLEGGASKAEIDWEESIVHCTPLACASSVVS